MIKKKLINFKIEFKKKNCSKKNLKKLNKKTICCNFFLKKFIFSTRFNVSILSCNNYL